jgi:hypothetical protein
VVRRRSIIARPSLTVRLLCLCQERDAFARVSSDARGSRQLRRLLFTITSTALPIRKSRGSLLILGFQDRRRCNPPSAVSMSHANARLVPRSMKPGYLNLRVKVQRGHRNRRNPSQHCTKIRSRSRRRRRSTFSVIPCCYPTNELLKVSRSPLTQMINNDLVSVGCDPFF